MPLSNPDRNAAADAVISRYDGGKFQLMNAARDTVLAEWPLPNPVPDAVNGVVTLNLASTTTLANGDAEAWQFRTAADALGYYREDAAAVSEAGGGGALVLNQASTAIVQGTALSGTFTITMPAGT